MLMGKIRGGPHVEVRQFEALLAIVETGSFTAAARQLHVTQSALSHQIKKLEQELQEALLVRASPRIYPSPAGNEVLLSAERIVGEVNRLKQRFAASATQEIVGTLRVAASSLGIVYLYGQLYELFLVRYPKIELVLTAAETPVDGVRQVITRSADVAFAPFPLELSDPDLQTVTLGHVEHVVIAAPKRASAGRDTVSVDDLRQLPFIRYVQGAGTRRATDRLFLPTGGYPPILMESNDTEFIKRAVRMGLGVAVVPYVTVRPEVDAGDLVALRIEGTTLVQDFGLVHRGNLRLRALEAFKALCIEHRDLIPGVLDGTASTRRSGPAASAPPPSASTRKAGTPAGGLRRRRGRR